jgi:hypothetical protein
MFFYGTNNVFLIDIFFPFNLLQILEQLTFLLPK